MTRYSKTQIEEAKTRLTAADGYALKPGDTIYSTVTHVARSGMSRSIRFFVMLDNRPHEITWAIARAAGYSMDDKNGGLKTSGCGMDMCFNTVYNLGRILNPKGFDLAPNQHGRNSDLTGHDNDGGYAYRSESL